MNPLSRSVLIASAAGSFLLLDGFRIWMPSLTTIFGSAGTTSAITLAVFAFSWPLAAIFALPLTVSRIGAWVPIVTVFFGVIARLVLQADIGGTAQLYASSVAVESTIFWFIAIAVRGWPTRSVASGIAIAIATTILMQLATTGLDLTWQPPSIGWPLLITALFLWLLGTWCWHAQPSMPGGNSLWFAMTPALFLSGVITISIGRTSTGIDWPPTWWSGAVIGVGAAAGIWITLRGGLWRSRWPAALLVIAAAALADLPRAGEAFPWWIAFSQGLLAFAIPTALAHSTQSSSSPLSSSSSQNRWQRGLKAYFGFIASFVLVIAYYVAFDLGGAIPRFIFIMALATFIGIASLGKSPISFSFVSRLGTATVIVFAFICGLTALLTSHKEPNQPELIARLPLKIMTYNIRYGISENGRFDPVSIASVISRENPDILMLQEVDRGFLLNGSHDVLANLQQKLQMHAYYNPASEPLFGDVILSRWKLRDARPLALPTYDVPTRSGVLSAVLPLEDGHELVLAVTHLHEKEGGVDIRQVADLAKEITTLSAGGEKLLVLAGDFNLEPSDPRLKPLLAVLRDGIATARPLPTWPAGDPKQQLNYIFLSQQLRASDIVVPATNASDHRPIVARISR